MPLSDRDYMRNSPPPRPRRTWRFNTPGGFGLSPIWVLIIINFLIFLVTAFSDTAFSNLAMVPALIGERPWTFVTCMFVHAGFIHILFNMIFLFFFGRTLVMFLGNNRFLLVYFLGGLAGNLVFLLLNLSSGVQLVGASAAIYGVAGALVVMAPNMRVALWGIIPMPLWVFVIVFLGILSLPGIADASIAWQAHFGGLAAGLIAGFYFRKKMLPMVYYR